MTPQRILEQFFIENEWCRTHTTGEMNKYNFPLTPSAMYWFCKWLTKRDSMAAKVCRIDDPAAECESLLARFGQRIKDGHVGSWNQ